MPEALGSAPNVFPLRIKYSKITVFVPVGPKTRVEEIKREALEALEVVSETPPEDTEAASFGDLDPTVDVGIYTGAPNSAAEGEDQLVFLRSDKGTEDDKTTVSDVGWADETNMIAYLGFRPRDGKDVAQPQVQVASLADEVPDHDAMEDDIPIPKFDQFGNEL